jgi:tRNA pseudouridine synthase 10
LVKTYGDKNITHKYKNLTNSNSINFFLCKFCFDRNFNSIRNHLIKYRTIVKIIRSKVFECYICKSLFNTQIKQIYNEIIHSRDIATIDRIKKINIGTHLSYTLYEREDYLRSLFKIKGIPNIKTHFNNLLRNMLENYGLFVDYADPDIKIDINMEDNLTYQIDYRTKEIILLGYYNKYRRGTSQRNIQNNKVKEKNSTTDQKDLDNIQGNKSIEDIIDNYIAMQFGSNNYKISWTGSEDKNSMVLGKGRPFIVRVHNPNIKKNQLPVKFLDHIMIQFQEIQMNDIVLYYQYKVNVTLWIEIIEDSIKIETEVLDRIVSSLIGDVKFRNKNKVVQKKIYSSSYRIIDSHNFQIFLLLDNGIPIKQLVGCNEFIEPCISNLIGTKCECIYFDIEDILINKCCL